MSSFIAWLGAVCLSICALPLAIKSFRDGHSDGISASFLALWALGEGCFLYRYIQIGEVPAALNCVFNLLFLYVVIRFKIWRRF